MIHVGFHRYSIFIPKAVFAWRLRQHKRQKPSATPRALLGQEQEATIHVDAPQAGTASLVRSEFGTVYTLLQVAVEPLPMAAVNGPFPNEGCCQGEEDSPRLQ